jgi:hypothetical protein
VNYVASSQKQTSKHRPGIRITLDAASVMPRVESSAIARIEYDDRSKKLSVWFVGSGGPYDFYNVPRPVYHAFALAPSKGAFFNAYIRDVYRVERTDRQRDLDRPGR